MDNKVYAALQSKARDELGALVVGQFQLFKSTLMSVYQTLVMAKAGTVGVNHIRLSIAAANATFQMMARNALSNHAFQVAAQHGVMPTELQELTDMTGDNFMKLADQHATRIEKACFRKLSGNNLADNTQAIYIDRLGRGRDAQEAVYLFTKMFAVSVDVRASVLSLQNAGKTSALMIHPDPEHEGYLVSLEDLSWVESVVHPNSKISVVKE